MPFRVGEHRFVQHRAQQAVHDEAGRVLDDTGVLPIRFAKALAASMVARRSAAAHQLDQRHEGTGLKKCRPRSARASGRRCELRDRDGRGVGREDRVAPQRVGLLEDPEFQLFVLRRRFDHQVAPLSSP